MQRRKLFERPFEVIEHYECILCLRTWHDGSEVQRNSTTSEALSLIYFSEERHHKCEPESAVYSMVYYRGHEVDTHVEQCVKAQSREDRADDE